MSEETDPHDTVGHITRDTRRLAGMRWRLFWWRVWKELDVLRHGAFWRGVAMLVLSGVGIMTFSFLWFYAQNVWFGP